MCSDDASDGVGERDDTHKLALIVEAKDSLRDTQRSRTWEQRVAAIARMNVANKIVKSALHTHVVSERASPPIPEPDPVAKWVGSVHQGPSTDELMRMTRGEDWNRE